MAKADPPEVTAALQRVKRAAAARARADLEYRSAIASAVAAGASFSQLARILRVSRQAVQQLVRRS